jgi:hypothetical protein
VSIHEASRVSSFQCSVFSVRYPVVGGHWSVVTETDAQPIFTEH